jgi:hypothetical protein
MSLGRLALMSAVVCLAATSCDELEPTAPGEALQSPAYDVTYTYGSYQLVAGTDWTFVRISNARVVGAAGGRVTLGFHELIVPRGAVERPTVFRISKTLGPHVRVDLSATDQRSGEQVTSFPRPVELRLSYRFVPLRGVDPARLVVLWLKDDSATGELVPVPTRVLPESRYVIGSLTHFSQYAMGLN